MPSSHRRGWSPRAIAAAVAAVFVFSTLPLTGAHASEVPGIELDGTGSLSGVVTNDEGQPVAGATVTLRGLVYLDEYDVWRWQSSLYGTTAADGSYTFTGRAAGTYAIGFSCPNCATPYLEEWWNDQYEQLNATHVELADGEHKQGLDAVISMGAAVSGRVAATDGTALPGVRVRVWNQDDKYRESETDASGEYRIDRLLPGRYRLQFVPPAGSQFAGEWHEGAYREYDATRFDLAKDQVLSGMNATLERTGSISGIVRGEHGEPIDAIVTYIPSGGFIERYASSLGDRGYTFDDLPPGWYRLSFEDDAVDDGYLTEWWNDKPWDVADWIEVGEGQDVTGIDADLAKQRVVVEQFSVSTMNPVVGGASTAILDSPTPGVVPQYQWFAGSVAIPGATSASFVPLLEHLDAGLFVRVVATAPGFSPVLRETYAGRVGPTPPAWGEVARIAGSDRYATSVAVSKTQFAPGVDTVFVANGMDFPDALSGAGIAALRDGPLLLTPSAGLPQTVIDEIKRLEPRSAIIFGGTGVVGPKVEAQLRELTGSYVSRFSGADRYATSAAIARMEFGSHNPSVVYIANGSTFPDALSGAPLAGQDPGPLLLSTATWIPDVIAAELDRLNPGRIVILGGTGAISDDVARQLQTYTTGGVTRLAGADRYATSVAISKANFDGDISVAYIANGTNFPDALSGAPVAAIQGGPVLLTPAGSLPSTVVEELQRLRPDRIVILGGPGAVSSAVETQLASLG
ncbi:cell wall-binding repeat-containing protein [Agromyces sp. H66]|uniref:cell wall-binding repeat-containing protein n=1 Tax=Agromyces sp. H66 TaxID=2529859 RepID=UPI0010AB43ED|nr:cell wall-binding repeat-containing protein [Agromyces sp. H66]